MLMASRGRRRNHAECGYGERLFSAPMAGRSFGRLLRYPPAPGISSIQVRRVARQRDASSQSLGVSACASVTPPRGSL